MNSSVNLALNACHYHDIIDRKTIDSDYVVGCTIFVTLYDMNVIAIAVSYTLR